jgi:DNA polymerase-3 subunit gamma/tau
MAYISLYRKYRPRSFADVVGQDVIIKILKNSIINNKIGHAYIFSGPRGTGKTSTAKIFANVVNCQNPIDGDVCGKCDICKNNGNEEIDIVEIDAASNNGVEEIREIKNSIKLLPVELKYKVYIIDEVHMLSSSAFNALLKTLEEPPAHAIFILATTEINKIPLTVLSRCQKFDFKKINKIDIFKRLEYIIKEEKINNIDKDILNLISDLSDGGLRDAINLLDQVNSLNKNNITQTDVLNLVGAINKNLIIEFLNSIIECNIINVIKNVKDFYDKRINFINVVNNLE